MSDSTTRHDYTPPPAATFQEPELQENWAKVERGLAKTNAAADRVREAMQAPTDPVPAEPAPPTGPEPLLEGTFAIYELPDESLIVVYRPRGANEDKRFILPAFLIQMATRQTGRTTADVIAAIREGNV